MAYDDAQLAAVLNDARRIAIVGLSRRLESPSYEVAVYLKSKGFQVIPVNPMYTEVMGTRSYQSVSEMPAGVDIVVVFRRPEHIADVAQDVIEAAPKYLWLQLGIRNDKAMLEVESRGIAVYQDICIKQTHQRLVKTNILKH
jgi:predicted CoA-binding protein